MYGPSQSWYLYLGCLSGVGPVLQVEAPRVYPGHECIMTLRSLSVVLVGPRPGSGDKTTLLSDYRGLPEISPLGTKDSRTTYGPC